MSTEPVLMSDPTPVPPPTVVPPRPRLWFPVLLVAAFWVFQVVISRLEIPYFIGFLSSMGAAAVVVVPFAIWWLFNRRVPFWQRHYDIALVLGLGALTWPLCHPSMRFGLLTTGLPIVLTVWTGWLLLVNLTGLRWGRLGLGVVVALTWTFFTLIRIDGVNTSLKADIRWRWEPTEEDLFLAEKSRQSPWAAASLPAVKLTLTAGDWLAFRGPERDGVIRGERIPADWAKSPPKLRWKHRVGPAWSSLIVIGDRLFTQEQRGPLETVVCYDASTGKELWVHEDPVRFWETVSGAGPRATPTFADGRLYTFGGTGLLNCLDAGTGRCHWMRDVAAQAGAKPPSWGYSGSPLVVDDKVIVYAGGPGDNGLIALHTGTGEKAWSAPAGSGSYSSPQLTTLSGRRQVLFLGEAGLSALDPANGAKLWVHGLAMRGAPRTPQAHLIGDSELVVPSLGGPGVARIRVSRDGDDWKVDQLWATTQMKTEFPDIVVYRDHAYGFDVNMFCCLELTDGRRAWKEGRYGRGQVMLLAEQGLMLVLSEGGEAILVEANPKRHVELGKFAALKGKSWNHPVVAHGRLYCRNAEEMACYDLGRE